MLEILLVVWLCKILGRTARRKGHRAGWYQFLLVVCWIAGEIGGGVAAGIIDGMQRGFGGSVYLAALAGAALGAGIAFLIVHSLPDRSSRRQRLEFECPSCGEQFSAKDTMCPVCGTAPAPAALA